MCLDLSFQHVLGLFATFDKVVLVIFMLFLLHFDNFCIRINGFLGVMQLFVNGRGEKISIQLCQDKVGMDFFFAMDTSTSVAFSKASIPVLA